MKLAFCFCGQPRDVKNTLENIKNAWTKNQDVDFFFHAWEGEPNEAFRSDVPSDLYEGDIFDFIIKSLCPKDYVIEKQKAFDKIYENSKNWNCYHAKYNPKPYQNIQSHFYSTKQVNLIRKKYQEQNNVFYDAVVKCRFDYIFNKNYDIKNYDLSCINVKNDCMHTDYAINDHIALSSSKNMDIYCSIFDYFDLYYNSSVEFNPEVLWGYHLKNQNVPIAKTLGDNTESYVSTQAERAKIYKGEI